MCRLLIGHLRPLGGNQQAADTGSDVKQPRTRALLRDKRRYLFWIILMVLDREIFYDTLLSTIATAAIAEIQLYYKRCALFEIS